MQYRTNNFPEPTYCHENGYESVVRLTNEKLLLSDGGVLEGFDDNAYGEDAEARRRRDDRPDERST